MKTLADTCHFTSDSASVVLKKQTHSTYHIIRIHEIFKKDRYLKRQANNAQVSPPMQFVDDSCVVCPKILQETDKQII